MKTRYMLGAVLIIAIIVIGIAVFESNSGANTAPQTTAAVTQTTASSSTAATSTSSGTAAQSYTMAQVAQHNGSSSCWSAINGNVYDLTDWINQHPGGPEHILGICGADGSAAFNAQHGGQSQPMQELQQFYIGTLAS